MLIYSLLLFASDDVYLFPPRILKLENLYDEIEVFMLLLLGKKFAELLPAVRFYSFESEYLVLSLFISGIEQSADCSFYFYCCEYKNETEFVAAAVVVVVAVAGFEFTFKYA